MFYYYYYPITTQPSLRPNCFAPFILPSPQNYFPSDFTYHCPQSLPVSEQQVAVCSVPSASQSGQNQGTSIIQDKKVEEEFPVCKQKLQMPFVDKHNIIPNNINHVLAFLQRKSKSLKIIEKIIRTQREPSDNFSPKGFYSYQNIVKEKLSIHVNLRSLKLTINHLDEKCSIFTVREQLFYNKVSRIAITIYLKNIAPLVTLNSQRLNNTNKIDHLKAQRFLVMFVANAEQDHLDLSARRPTIN